MPNAEVGKSVLSNLEELNTWGMLGYFVLNRASGEQPQQPADCIGRGMPIFE